MRTPPLLLGFVILFWGWRTGFFTLAFFMTLAIEGSRLIHWRWDFRAIDFNRIADVTAVVIFGIVIYLFVTHGLQKTPFMLMKIIPVAFLPLFLVQIYSRYGKITLSALFYTYRHSKELKTLGKEHIVDLSYPYILLVLLSASIINTPSNLFYFGLFLCVGWGLFSIRSSRFSLITWFFFMILVGLIGFVGQIGLHRLHNYIDETSWLWFTPRFENNELMHRSVSLFGEIGDIKLSDRIILRVHTKNITENLLLRAGAYNEYAHLDQTGRAVWIARPGEAEILKPVFEGQTWMLKDFSGLFQRVTVSEVVPEGKGILKLPGGSYKLRNLNVGTVKQNKFNTIIINESPERITYDVEYNSSLLVEQPPLQNDIIVPEEEHVYIENIASGLNLSQMNPSEAIEVLIRNFRVEYDYSLKSSQPPAGISRLEHFLLKSKSGHCELFASATALLLRAANIPTRYAVGFLVHEYSNLEDCYIVRSRDAHAWCLAYYDGFWHDVDTTPPSWITIDDQTNMIWRNIKDIFSWFHYTITGWKMNGFVHSFQKYWWVLVLILVLLLFWRLFFQVRIPRLIRKLQTRKEAMSKPGADSPMFRIERTLKKSGYVRHNHETLAVFYYRLSVNNDKHEIYQSLIPMLRIHNKYRFDPEGISEEDKQTLQHDVERWLEEYTL